MFRAMTLLGTCILLVWTITLAMPRATPGSSAAEPFVFALPLIAHRAAKSWYNGPVFFAYGAIGMTAFIPPSLSSTRLGLTFIYSNTSPIEIVAFWIACVVFVGTLCRFVGKSTYLSKHPPMNSA